MRWILVQRRVLVRQEHRLVVREARRPFTAAGGVGVDRELLVALGARVCGAAEAVVEVEDPHLAPRARPFLEELEGLEV